MPAGAGAFRDAITMKHKGRDEPRDALADPAGLQRALEETWEWCRDRDGGHLATYIPELAKVDPDRFSLTACTPSGEVVAVGDSGHGFTLQSLCKPFLYGGALKEHGAAAVAERVGVEPTGDAFDSIVRLESGTHRPHNPMVNAGALAVAGLFVEHPEGDPVGRMLSLFEDLTGRSGLQVDGRVHDSEHATADRNRAMAWLMAHFGMLRAPVESVLEVYLKACSLVVTCRDLAVLAGTLAAGGTNPVTHVPALPRTFVRDVLAVMATCGMYDAAGAFALDVGLPAKSGVSGGLMAVVPGRLGLAAFSPRVDDHGTSVRGLSALRGLASHLPLHPLQPDPATPRAAPPRDLLRTSLSLVHERWGAEESGHVAPYLDGMPSTDPALFALAACTTGGEEAAVGDADAAFSLQAAVNPLAYGLALESAGVEAVHARVGVEPSGNPYHAIVFDPRRNRPHNPLGNAGALALTPLLPGYGPEQRAAGLRQALGRFCGGDALAPDPAVLERERAHAARNRAIAHLLRNFGILEDVETALRVYLEWCSLATCARGLARLAGTLAHGGCNPLTGVQLLEPPTVRRVLSLMFTCGMHDGTGRFIFEAGLPAKSGVSGAILAVAPGRMGLAALSPRVDPRGASVRGQAALADLSRTLGLDILAG